MRKNNKKGTIMDIKNLEVEFHQEEGKVNAVNGVNFSIKENQSIGIVGESGCGKSVTSLSILRILPSTGEIKSGEINYRAEDGKIIDLSKLEPDGYKMRNIRGKEISMVFQEPMTAFSPVHTIGDQISEAILLHQNVSKSVAYEKTIEMLSRVGISNPKQRLSEYPFQFSGGMRQRAMIAMALVCQPRLLIADEPTTALDVTIQAQVLKLMKDMQKEFNISLMLITHDLGVIAHMVDYVYVMYLGYIVEEGPINELFDNPKHPYTIDLLNSIPKLRGNEGKLSYIKGTVPDAHLLPRGCYFNSRCQVVECKSCFERRPDPILVGENHKVACYKYTKEGVNLDA